MCQPNYVPLEAIKEENIVKIALWNGKIFHAGVVDIFDNGGRLHIVRLSRGRVVRREVLKIDYGPGNIRAISSANCGHILKGINSDKVLPGVSGAIYRNMSKINNTGGILNKTIISREFLEFKRQQERFFKEREMDAIRLNEKIVTIEGKFNER